jgi:hypothetical protein
MNRSGRILCDLSYLLNRRMLDIIALASARGPILPPPNHPSLKNVHFPSIFASSEWKIEIAKKKFFEFFENF